jgi:hypothetical protein
MTDEGVCCPENTEIACASCGGPCPRCNEIVSFADSVAHARECTVAKPLGACACDCHAKGKDHKACCAKCPHCGRAIASWYGPAHHVAHCAKNPSVAKR